MKATEKQSQRYQRIIRKHQPKKPYLRNLVGAFLVGGVICTIGQLILNGFVSAGMTAKAAAVPTSALMIIVGAVLTGLGVYDEIGRFGGMGAALPITGFANSIVAPAMEFRREGMVLGLGAKLFTVAGPVLVYGLAFSTVAAACAYLLGVRAP